MNSIILEVPNWALITFLVMYGLKIMLHAVGLFVTNKYRKTVNRK